MQLLTDSAYTIVESGQDQVTRPTPFRIDMMSMRHVHPYSQLEEGQKPVSNMHAWVTAPWDQLQLCLCLALPFKLTAVLNMLRPVRTFKYTSAAHTHQLHVS
jgi:hypothetical protein